MFKNSLVFRRFLCARAAARTSGSRGRPLWSPDPGSDPLGSVLMSSQTGHRLFRQTLRLSLQVTVRREFLPQNGRSSAFSHTAQMAAWPQHAVNVLGFCASAGKFYCKPHYCYRLSGYAQRKRPAPSPAPAPAKVPPFCSLDASPTVLEGSAS